MEKVYSDTNKLTIKQRDKNVFKDLAHFKGLTVKPITEIHFNGSSYARARLSDYIKSGYVNKE